MAAQNVIDIETGRRQDVDIGDVARSEGEVGIDFRTGDEQSVLQAQLFEGSLERRRLGGVENGLVEDDQRARRRPRARTFLGRSNA